MARSYIEIIYIDREDLARHTNLARSADTNAATRAEFNSYRRYGIGIKQARFVLDYYNRKGDLADTIPIDEAGFEAITGQTPKSDEDYCAIDAAYWQHATTPLADAPARARRG